MSEMKSWEIEKALNELVEEWAPATGEASLERADLVIKKLKHPPKVCEDCGKIVSNRIIALTANKLPYPHWKEGCKACDRWRDPRTGKFTAKANEITNIYRLKNQRDKHKG